MSYGFRGSGINRNILECKYRSERLDKLRIAVLIETYWNVNQKGEDVTISSLFGY